jgi:uncharacterized protein YqjF (DUF2071 family)
MAQRWNTLLFAHWKVSADTLRPLIPSALTLDTYEGSAWVSITPFYLSHLRARALPAFPWLSEFPELNVRTYVTLGGKPGVYFFSLDAGSILAVAGARATYHLPYYRASMNVRAMADGAIEYHSHRTHSGAPGAELRARYRPVGDPYHSEQGTLDHWLTERYCLYAVDSARHVYRAEIHHRPWLLRGAETEISVNTMARANGIELAGDAQRLTYTHLLDVVVWPPDRIV